MTLKLNGSSSGYTTLDAPASGGNRAITFPDAAGTVALTSTAGKVLQIVANTRNETYSENIGSTHFWGPAEFETKITPSATSSKILIQGHFCVDGAIAMGVNCQIKKDGSVLAGANGATASNRKLTHSGVKSTGERMVNLPITYLDSPNTTSEVAYKFWFTHTSGSARVVYINQSHEDTDNAEISRAVSTILLTEIAG